MDTCQIDPPAFGQCHPLRCDPSVILSADTHMPAAIRSCESPLYVRLRGRLCLRGPSGFLSSLAPLPMPRLVFSVESTLGQRGSLRSHNHLCKSKSPPINNSLIGMDTFRLTCQPADNATRFGGSLRISCSFLKKLSGVGTFYA